VEVAVFFFLELDAEEVAVEGAALSRVGDDGAEAGDEEDLNVGGELHERLSLIVCALSFVLCHWSLVSGHWSVVSGVRWGTSKNIVV